jgi:hypothetical protein
MQRALQALRRESAGSSVVSQSVASRSVDSQSADSRSAVGAPASVASSPEPQAVALARVAHAINANAAVLNNLMFTHLDYAAVAFRS